MIVEGQSRQLTSTRRSMSADTLHAGERHGDIQFLGDDFDRPGDARLAAGAQTEDVGAADEAAFGAERQRAHHVLARADAAIEHEFDLRAHCIGNFGQHRDRRRRAVELPAAVIGDDDGGGTGAGRDPGIFHIEYALDDQLAGPQAADPLDILPAESGIELRRGPFGKRPRRPPCPSRDRRDCRRSSACRTARCRPSRAWSPC